MNPVGERLDYRDLEPLLCDAKNAVYLLHCAVEEALAAVGKDIGRDAADALSYASHEALDRSKTAWAHWYAVFEAERQKTAA